MAQFGWSEIFLSIEGEGPYSGWPTVYVRFTGCDMTCQGFNNPEMKEITNEVLGFDPKDYSRLEDLPIITIGCDSIYSWDTRFRHLWKTGDENELADAVMEVVPHHQWSNPITGHPTILSLTGGEPTLRWKKLPLLLNSPQFQDLKILLFETNCSVAFKEDFIDELNAWQEQDHQRMIIWSNSPKLSVSGEPWKKAIRPDIAFLQTKVYDSLQYFKFVCGADERDFEEVAKAMSEYYEYFYDNGLTLGPGNVYIMPMACTEEQQNEISAKVAHMCMDKGYVYCHRIQNSVFGNTVGT